MIDEPNDQISSDESPSSLQSWNEEDFLPSPVKPKSPLSRRPQLSALWYPCSLFGFWILLSLHSWLVPNGGWASRSTVFDQGEWWRLFTALCVHADIGHLLSNAPLFIIFGWYLNYFFGFVAFPLSALTIGALSHAVTLLFYKDNTQLIGASGMLYGMISLWLVLYVRFETVYSLPQKMLRAAGAGVILLFPTTFHPTTSYAAHFWGFIIGLIFGLILIPIVKNSHSLRPILDSSAG